MAGAATGQVASSSEHTKGNFCHSPDIGHRYGRSQRVQTGPHCAILHQMQTGDAGYHTDGRPTRVRLVSANYQTICVIPRPGNTDGRHVHDGRCYTRTLERDPSASERGGTASRAEERGDDSSAGTGIIHGGAAVERGDLEEQHECRYGYREKEAQPGEVEEPNAENGVSKNVISHTWPVMWCKKINKKLLSGWLKDG